MTASPEDAGAGIEALGAAAGFGSDDPEHLAIRAELGGDFRAVVGELREQMSEPDPLSEGTARRLWAHLASARDEEI